MNFINRLLNKIKVTVQDIYYFIVKDKIILSDTSLKTNKNKVNLHYHHENNHNLGDDLSPVVVDYMLRKKGLSLNSSTTKTKHLYSIGSILFFGHQNATVWGSGLLTKPRAGHNLLHTKLFRKLDIRSVRGPFTQAELEKRGFKCPSIYGDPGCLMPLIYTPNVEKNLDYLVIPHHINENELKNLVPKENFISIMTDDYKSVIDKICSAKKVISCSLHGIILAESYGIPTVFYNCRENLYDFKYLDWYHSTGRTEWPAATELEEAIAMNLNSYSIDLTKMQNKLIDSFPYDLWEN